MKLNIPLKSQKKNSKDCGLVCSLMIDKFFNGKLSFKDIQKEIKIHKVWTYAPQIGTFMIKHGYSVEMITQQPSLFTNKDKKISQKEILHRIEQTLQKDKKNKKTLSYFMEFLKIWGKITVKIPNIQDIQESIKKKSPLIALLTTNFIGWTKPGFNFHFNVIDGIDNKYVYLNDPLIVSEWWGKIKCNINDFFFGLYASTYGDLDNGSLLKITKK